MTEDKDETFKGVKTFIHPPTAFLSGVVAGFVLDKYFPVPLSIPYDNLIGGAFSLAGLFLAIWAGVAFHASGQSPRLIHATEALIDSGPYRYSRNPIYLSMGLIGAGVAIATTNIWMFATVAIALFLIRVDVITKEEAHLSELFGDAFQDYRKKVRRWL